MFHISADISLKSKPSSTPFTCLILVACAKTSHDQSSQKLVQRLPDNKTQLIFFTHAIIDGVSYDTTLVSNDECYFITNTIQSYRHRTVIYNSAVLLNNAV
jgi:hypothetical protein